MSDIKGKTSTRRAFFVNGGAVLGAGVATTVGAAALRPEHPPQAGSAEDREAIRRLHLAAMAQLENQRDATAANLFDEHGLVRLGAYRQTTSQHQDEVTFSADGQRAAAIFHCEVELCTPLEGDCTAAQMARLQGQTDTRRWERGRFEGSYVRARGEWTTEALSYRAA
jgi:SnoaL-like domain